MILNTCGKKIPAVAWLFAAVVAAAWQAVVAAAEVPIAVPVAATFGDHHHLPADRLVGLHLVRIDL